MNRLDPVAADRLVKLLGLLSSQHPGERAAAGLKADQLIRSHGLVWADIIVPGDAPELAPAAPKWREPGSVAEAIGACLAHQEPLSAWEKEFLAGLGRFRRLSRKQQDILNRLLDTCRAYAATRRAA